MAKEIPLQSRSGDSIAREDHPNPRGTRLSDDQDGFRR